MRILLLALLSFCLGLGLAFPARARADGPLYLALGDSLAVGVGASDRASTAYVPLVYQRIQNSPRLRDRNLQLLNLGISGETTSSILLPDGQLDKAIAELKARNGDDDSNNDVEVITIDIGGNDLLGLLTDLLCAVNPRLSSCQARLDDALRSASGNLETIFRRLREAAGPGTIIATMTYYNPFSGTGTALDEQNAADRLNQTINSVASSPDVKAYIADVYPAFQSRGPQLTHIQGTLPDIHPNDAGYEMIASTFVGVLEQPLSRPPGPEAIEQESEKRMASWIYVAVGSVIAVGVAGAIVVLLRRRAQPGQL